MQPLVLLLRPFLELVLVHEEFGFEMAAFWPFLFGIISSPGTCFLTAFSLRFSEKEEEEEEEEEEGIEADSQDFLVDFECVTSSCFRFRFPKVSRGLIKSFSCTVRCFAFCHPTSLISYIFSFCNPTIL